MENVAKAAEMPAHERSQIAQIDRRKLQEACEVDKPLFWGLEITPKKKTTSCWTGKGTVKA
jgi:hypothetical protein